MNSPEILLTKTQFLSNSHVDIPFHSNAITPREPFHISFKFEKLIFSQASVLNNLVLMWNEELKASRLNKKKPQKSYNQEIFSKDQNQAVFFLELYQVTNCSLQKQLVSSSIAFGQVNDISATTRISQYPVDITEIILNPKQQMNSFIFSYSPQRTQEFMFTLSMQLSQNAQEKVFIGECRLNTNLYIETYLDEGIQCQNDCKKIVKRIDGDKQMDQQVEIMFEVAVARDRLQLEIAMHQVKRGISVTDFKQHIRQILMQKQQLQIKEENTEQKSSVQNPCQADQYLQILSLNKKSSTLQKYLSYLNHHVESKLQYFNPQKEKVQKEVIRLFSQRRQGIENKQKKVKKIQQNQLQRQAKNIKQKTSVEKHQTVIVGKEHEGRYKEIVKAVIFVLASLILLYFSMKPTQKEGLYE